MDIKQIMFQNQGLKNYRFDLKLLTEEVRKLWLRRCRGMTNALCVRAVPVEPQCRGWATEQAAGTGMDWAVPKAFVQSPQCAAVAGRSSREVLLPGQQNVALAQLEQDVPRAASLPHGCGGKAAVTCRASFSQALLLLSEG